MGAVASQRRKRWAVEHRRLLCICHACRTLRCLYSYFKPAPTITTIYQSSYSGTGLGSSGSSSSLAAWLAPWAMIAEPPPQWCRLSSYSVPLRHKKVQKARAGTGYALSTNASTRGKTTFPSSPEHAALKMENEDLVVQYVLAPYPLLDPSVRAPGRRLFAALAG